MCSNIPFLSFRTEATCYDEPVQEELGDFLVQPGSDEEDVYLGVPEDAYLMEDNAMLLNEVEFRADWVRDDHQCSLRCDCLAVESEEPSELGKYLDWGSVEVTETGKEVLRFMATIMKGKSMSLNKMEDILRCVLIHGINCIMFFGVLCFVMPMPFLYRLTHFISLSQLRSE